MKMTLFEALDVLEARYGRDWLILMIELEYDDFIAELNELTGGGFRATL